MKALLAALVLTGIVSFKAFCQEIKGTYAIKNVKTGMLLRIKDASTKNGTPIVAYNPQNWKCMTWDFKSLGPNTYQLENLFSHKTLQPAATAAVGVAFEEQPMQEGSNNQQYEFISVKKDTFLIRLKGSNLYITPADPDGEVNSAIILAEKSGSSLQEWTIYKQTPTM